MSITWVDKPKTGQKCRIIEVKNPGKDTVYYCQKWSDGWLFGLFGKGWRHIFESSSVLDAGGEYANPLGFKTKEEAEQELEIARTDTEINVLALDE